MRAAKAQLASARQERAVALGSAAMVTPLPIELHGGAAERRLRRGQLRRRAHGAAAQQTRRGALSFLELNAVRPGTAKNYFDKIDELNRWCGQQAQDMDPPQLDGLLCEYFEDQYFAGYNADTADKMLAALQFANMRVTLRSPCTLPRAVIAARGFKRLAPGLSRAPFPYLGLVAMIAAAASQGQWIFAVALAVHFTCYLRPNELLSLTAKQVVMPSRSSTSRVPSLLLNPLEDGTTGKTQEFDESVLVDWPNLDGLHRALQLLKNKHKAGMPLFNLSHKEYHDLFLRFGEISGVSVLKAHPYSLRHGGASYQYLNKHLSLSAIKRKGRWRADSSVRRYEKSSRAALEEQRLPLATRDYALRWAPQLSQILAKDVRPDGPPYLAKVVSTAASKKRKRSG